MHISNPVSCNARLRTIKGLKKHFIYAVMKKNCSHHSNGRGRKYFHQTDAMFFKTKGAL